MSGPFWLSGKRIELAAMITQFGASIGNFSRLQCLRGHKKKQHKTYDILDKKDNIFEIENLFTLITSFNKYSQNYFTEYCAHNQSETSDVGAPDSNFKS